MNIAHIPLSYGGSYMAIAEFTGCKKEITNFIHDNSATLEQGIYLKSLRGKSRNKNIVCRLIPTVNCIPIKYTYEADYGSVILKLDGGEIKICFNSEHIILIEGTGVNVGMILDFIPTSNYDSSIVVHKNGQTYYILNNYKTLTKYIAHTQKGSTEQIVKYTDSKMGLVESKLYTSGDSGFQYIMEEIPTHMIEPTEVDFNFEESYQKSLKSFKTFLKSNKIEQINSYDFELASYIMWSCLVEKQDLLTRDGIYMSNNFFQGIWSWDHCINALGLVNYQPQLAYNQLMLFFDYQDEKGQIPGSVSDSTVRWNFSKPPIHGMCAEIIMKKIPLDNNKLNEMIDRIGKQVNFYFNYKDFNNNGIPEYHHGNDSGHDNSTVFEDSFILESPDLAAFIVKSMEFLSKACFNIGDNVNGELWSKRADKLAEKIINSFIVDNKVKAYDINKCEHVESKSILPYFILVLGTKYLDKKLVEELICIIRKQYLTDYGLATESPLSEKYQSDGYWRGPIWAPTTVLMIEALKNCEEVDFANELASKFIKLINKSGFAENFDAISGEPLQDKAYTWTAGAYLYLLNQ